MKRARSTLATLLVVFMATALLINCAKKEESETGAAPQAASAATWEGSPGEATPGSETPNGPSIVYNAQLSPQFVPHEDSSHPAIREGTLTSLRFAIDRPWSQSEIHVAPNPQLTSSPTDVPLTVTLSCDFCTQHQPFIVRTVYRVGQQRTDPVTFTFVPMRDKQATGAFLHGKLILSILNRATGREYDRLPLPVTVIADQGGVTIDRTDAIGTSVLPPMHSQAASKTDVFLHVLKDDRRGLAIVIEPFEPRLEAALRRLVTDESGGLRVFQTGLSTAQKLQQRTFAAYSRISRLSNQRDSEASLKRDGIPVISKKAQTSLYLSADESKGAERVIARFGMKLYRQLFLDGPDGKALGAALATLEKMDIGRPVRLTIRTDDINLPWQYIHPQQREQDARQFWGMKFSLAVRRAENALYTGNDLDIPASSGQSVFARYGVEDETTAYAVKQFEKLRELQGAQALDVDSKEKLKQALAKHRDSISAIFTFLHAASGKVDIDIGDGKVASLDTTAGPLLSFKPQGEDDVTSDELEELREGISRADFHERPYLSAGPLVILNACETGPSTISVPHLSLEEAMFTLGARGVLLTEVPVWVSLGHEVSVRLIDKLSRGETASDAITAIRRELLAEKGNPLGLLYAYYGDPDATWRAPIHTAEAGK